MEPPALKKVVLSMAIGKAAPKKLQPSLAGTKSDEPPVEYITTVTEHSLDAVAKPILVIPLTKNGWRGPAAVLSEDPDAEAINAILHDAHSLPDIAQRVVAPILPMSAPQVAGAGARPILLEAMIPGIADLKDDGEKFKFDIQHRAANIDARSECYEKIPISDFGEGLLRGMGWGGSRLDSEEAHAVGRPARLGLGATPKPPSPPPEHRRIKKSGQVSTKGAVERALWEREVAKKLDSQKLEVGDVVWLKDPRFLRGSEVSRATVHRTSGVAGLNRIEVVLEAPDGQVATVLKTDAVLVDAKELAAKPFRASQSSSGKRQPTKGDASATDKRPAPLTDKRPRVEEADGKSNAHSSSSSSSSLWAVPRIRVRIVEKGARYDQLKGLVTKISEGRCTVLLDDGTEVKDLKEAALETVVPSVDDMVYVVAGRFRHAKGPILMKDRDREEVCLEIDGKRQYLRFDDVCSLAN